MTIAQISNIQLQPLAVSASWTVVQNNFYAIDPDQQIHAFGIVCWLDSSEPEPCITDPWDDILRQYFDSTYLWIGTCRMYELTLDWDPMDDRDGAYRLRFYRNIPLRFSEMPKQKITRWHEGHQLTYKLTEPIEPATSEDFDNPDKELITRDRTLVARTMEQWMQQAK